MRNARISKHISAREEIMSAQASRGGYAYLSSNFDREPSCAKTFPYLNAN